MIWTFERKLESHTYLNSETSIHTLTQELERLKVDQIEVGRNRIVFGNSFFNGQGRNHLMASVDSGQIIFDSARKQLIYSISIKRMMWILTFISLLFLTLCFTSNSIFPIIPVIWLFGANLLSTRIRHRRFSKKMIDLIQNC